MDIKILRYFLQICRDGSFSKAAKNLYISQPGLSKSISNLEKELGVSVFNRTSKGNELTEYGEYLKNKASTIVYQFDILTEGINEIKQKNKKFLNIGVPFGVINSLSFDLINEFNKIYPDIILIQTNEMILVTDFSKRNEGIGISIHFSHTPNCKINYIPFKDESFTWDIYMVTKKNTIIDDTMKKFMDFIEDNSIARNNLILKEDVI